MVINEINLTNFRNYENQYVKLNNGINVFYGDNAQGKTNLLEAIFICSIGKSFRTNKDSELMKFNSTNTKIDISYNRSDRSGKVSLELSNSNGNKKRFLLNNIPLKKTSEVLGNIYIVLFTPDDIAILKDGPANRRRFLNIMISQLRPSYMRILYLYNKTMLQRNTYLRQIKFENKSKDMLDIWDKKLSEYGKYIYEYRKEFIGKIACRLNNVHSKITNNKEDISIEYVSSLNEKENFYEQLKSHRDIDIQRGSTYYRYTQG